MKGSFKITLDYLKELGACRDGQREFQKAFPNGGEYQEVLDRCAEEERPDFASWLFDHVGKTEDIRVYDEEINDPSKIIFFAGRIEFKFKVSARTIFAGEGIVAGEGIKAGDDFYIFAGLCIKKSMWEFSAIVTASTKPNNLMSGFWKPLGDDTGESGRL